MSKSQSMSTVLIACGSFNPITNMHLRMFELAKDYLLRKTDCKVNEGIISPVHDSYPTSKTLVNSKHRIEMVRRSLRPLNGENHWVRVDDWECSQNEWSRTVKVLRHHYERLAARDADINLKLVCGADLFDTFNVPDLWSDDDINEIVGKHGLIVVTREGFNPRTTLLESNKSHILLQHKEQIHIISDKISNAISSTIVRESIKNGESVRYLIDDSVLEYIQQNKLYK